MHLIGWVKIAVIGKLSVCANNRLQCKNRPHELLSLHVLDFLMPCL